MNASLPCTLLLTALALGCSAQDAQHFESRHFSFECGEVAHTALSYLPKHGLSTSSLESDSELRVFRADRAPWTDADGKVISDFRVYWNYADRKTGERLPFGVWHMRLEHYTPSGEFKMTPDEGGCQVAFRLLFSTSGGNVIGIIPVDASWEYWSNGRMEREYLAGIAASMEKREPPPKMPSESRQ